MDSRWKSRKAFWNSWLGAIRHRVHLPWRHGEFHAGLALDAFMHAQTQILQKASILSGGYRRIVRPRYLALMVMHSAGTVRHL